MVESRLTRALLRLGAGATLAFIYVAALRHRDLRVQREHLADLADRALHDEVVRRGLATTRASGRRSRSRSRPRSERRPSRVVLGTLASLAVSRYRFFGRETISFLVILPIALPGIITGLALQATILNVLTPLGISFSIWTIIIGHATFCIVVIYNNAVARMRRISGSLEEASMDLGADIWQTFRYVTFPQLRTALLAGGLLAFALSFDEVIVTIFTSGAQQTLPIWIFTNFARPSELPIVNVVALFVIVASIIPVWIAQRVAGGSGLAGERPRQEDVGAVIDAEP